MFYLKKIAIVGGTFMMVCVLVVPSQAYLYTPSAVYNHSGYKSSYLPERTIDRLVSSSGSLVGWVSNDDTTVGDPPTWEAPVTGHIVLDMGQATTMQHAWIWSRYGSGTPYGAKDVKFFYFDDDNPANILGAIDDIETDPNIVEAWSGQLDPITSMKSQVVPFTSAITKRYIGMRIDSSQADQNFQIGELAFGTAGAVPGVAPTLVYAASNVKSASYLAEYSIDASYVTESDIVPSHTWLVQNSKWVAQDDTGTAPNDPPVTGHIVYDMGSATQISDMTIWSKQDYDTALPKDVKVFYYNDDVPTMLDPIDDIEHDPNITLAWSGTLKEAVYGLHQTVAFGTPFTKRYVGLRIDSSYEQTNDNFQIEEIRFNTGNFDPDPLPGVGAASVYSHSGEKVATYVTYHAAWAVDGIDFRGNQWVSNDDTTVGGLPAGPVTGHIVLDMGSATELESATFWGSWASGTVPLGPKDVKFFYYGDDDPTNNTGLLDDIEGDEDIIELWSGTLDDIVSGETCDVFFGESITKRYIGLRIESSWATDNFQIAELRFNAALSPTPIPGDTNNDRVVDEDDAATLATNWGRTDVSGASDGDFNGDQAVNAADASILAANWGDHRGEGSAGAVPEPSAVVMMAVLAVFAAWRRRTD